MAPVSSPTRAPVATPTGGSCVDQPLAFKNKAKQDCDWVAQKAEQRCSKNWKNKPLSEYCPVACDVDCNDAPVPAPVAAPVSDDESDDESEDDGACVDQPLSFKNKSKFNCDWVGEKPHARCDKEWKNKELWEYCPVACDECFDTVYPCESTRCLWSIALLPQKRPHICSTISEYFYSLLIILDQNNYRV